MFQNDVSLIKEGDKVGASEATLLNMLKISPFTYGLIIQQGKEGYWIMQAWMPPDFTIGYKFVMSSSVDILLVSLWIFLMFNDESLWFLPVIYLFLYIPSFAWSEWFKEKKLWGIITRNNISTCNITCAIGLCGNVLLSSLLMYHAAWLLVALLWTK